MEEIKAYKCDFCRKYSRSKSYIKKHEKECYHNPTTRSCATCWNLCSKTRERNSENGEYIVNEAYSVCSKGIEVCILDDARVKQTLRHHCDLWEKNIEIEDEY